MRDRKKERREREKKKEEREKKERREREKKKEEKEKKRKKRKRKEYKMFVGYFYLVLAYILLGGILYLNIVAQKKFMESKQIYITNPPTSCTYNSQIPGVNIDTLPQCKDSNNQIVPNYYIYSLNGVEFIVTNQKQTYYTKVCDNFCVAKNKNGNCDTPNNRYNSCVSLLEPPSGCKNPAKPLFVNSKNEDPYFATGIFGSGDTNCISKS